MSEHRRAAPGHLSWHGSARHGTAHRSSAQLTGVLSPAAALGTRSWPEPCPGRAGRCVVVGRERGLPCGVRVGLLLGGGCMCAAVCLCARPFSEAALSPKAFACSGGTFPALVVSPFFYSGCTCANKTLPGAKVPGCQERRSCAGSHPGDAPSQPRHPRRSGQGVSAGTNPAQKLVLQSLFPRGGTAENAACLCAAKCPGC